MKTRRQYVNFTHHGLASAKYIKGGGINVKQVDWINSIRWSILLL